MVERLVIMCEDSLIDSSILPANLLNSNRLTPPLAAPALSEKGVNLNAIVRELEGRMINEALKQSAGNKQAAAACWGSSGPPLPLNCAVAV
jgi:DNA-binding NtrC family response regulator